jgi:hypothetical protein
VGFLRRLLGATPATRQLRYADRAWTPPAQGGERRAGETGAPED